ncbi:hypothetical protein RJT34_12408 [Clitoria ternatea]|uniref:Uncharacterized protein n=1 Tax=Clitoria ternatea TaxID=43366 RepID=A0AAN9JLZ2_CLITE
MLALRPKLTLSDALKVLNEIGRAKPPLARSRNLGIWKSPRKRNGFWSFLYPLLPQSPLLLVVRNLKLRASAQYLHSEEKFLVSSSLKKCKMLLNRFRS